MPLESRDIGGYVADLRLMSDPKWGTKEHGREVVADRLDKIGIKLDKDGRPVKDSIADDELRIRYEKELAEDYARRKARRESKQTSDVKGGPGMAVAIYEPLGKGETEDDNVVDGSFKEIKDDKNRDGENGGPNWETRLSFADLIENDLPGRLSYLETLRNQAKSPEDFKRAQDKIDEAKREIKAGEAIVMPESSEARLNDARNKLLDYLELRLTASSSGMARPITVEYVSDWLDRSNAPESFRKEAVALMELVNASLAKRYFADNPSAFGKSVNKDFGKIPRDVADDFRDVYQGAYRDKTFVDILFSSEVTDESRGNISRAWAVFSEHATRSGDPGYRPLVPMAVELYKGHKKVTAEFETEYISEVAQKLGVSKYEARIAYSLFEGFQEAEVNDRHFLWNLTHFSDWANTMRMLTLWGSSLHWWDQRIGGHEDADAFKRINVLPKRLWSPTAYKYDGLATDISRINGVDSLKRLLENPNKPDEGVTEKQIVKDLVNAVKLQSSIMEIGPKTPGVEMGAQRLIDIRAKIKLLMLPPDAEFQADGYYDYNEALRILLTTSRVMLMEVEPRADLGRDEIEDPKSNSIRALAPFALWEMFSTLCNQIEPGHGFFELVGKGNLDKYSRIVGEWALDTRPVSPGEARKRNLLKKRIDGYNSAVDNISGTSAQRNGGIARRLLFETIRGDVIRNIDEFYKDKRFWSKLAGHVRANGFSKDYLPDHVLADGERVKIRDKFLARAGETDVSMADQAGAAVFNAADVLFDKTVGRIIPKFGK